MSCFTLHVILTVISRFFQRLKHCCHAGHTTEFTPPPPPQTPSPTLHPANPAPNRRHSEQYPKPCLTAGLSSGLAKLPRARSYLQEIQDKSLRQEATRIYRTTKCYHSYQNDLQIRSPSLGVSDARILNQIGRCSSHEGLQGCRCSKVSLSRLPGFNGHSTALQRSRSTVSLNPKTWLTLLRVCSSCLETSTSYDQYHDDNVGHSLHIFCRPDQDYVENHSHLEGQRPSLIHDRAPSLGGS